MLLEKLEVLSLVSGGIAATRVDSGQVSRVFCL